MNLQQLPTIVTHTTELFSCGPVNKLWKLFIYHILLAICFWAFYKCLLISLYLVQSKCAKMKWQEVPSIGRTVLEIFCELLHSEFLSDLPEKFQESFTYDTNVGRQIWSFCCNLFLSYADNRHTDTHTHRPNVKNMIFGFRGPQNV